MDYSYILIVYFLHLFCCEKEYSLGSNIPLVCKFSDMHLLSVIFEKYVVLERNLYP